ncbi:MAG: hypothetical protein MUE87_01900 [Methanothrix sp.]|jgi:2,3-bisphosphoglycerate-independent phosphoglycerate mutase|nr:hypothetical protein [Methanothrix sp.]
MDHATPISIKTQSRDPVPIAVACGGVETDRVQSFDETAAKVSGYGMVEAMEHVEMMKS